METGAVRTEWLLVCCVAEVWVLGARWVGLLFGCLPGAVAGQDVAPAVAPLMSPEAAYEQALAPVEITHRAISNWSDTETAALAVAVQKAREACAARVAVTYGGEDLMGYARLCALGQQWPAVVLAATAYLGPKLVASSVGAVEEVKPQKTQAHAYLVEGALHMNDEKTALARALDMLGAVPYSVLTDAVVGEALRYMQLAYTEDALVLAGVREGTVLKLLQGWGGGAGAGSVGAADVVPAQVLYADGLGFAALAQYDGQMDAAKAAVVELDTAVPAGLTADAMAAMAVARRQYEMLGRPLPEIAAAASLFSPTETPRINRRFGTATILLLFPPWCAQCVRTGKDMLPAMFRLNSEGAEVHLYGLLADDPPPVAAASTTARRGRGSAAAADGAAGGPKTAAEMLRGTPTLVVAPAVLGQFGAEDFPFVIATDHGGVVRLLLAGAPEDAMAAGSTVDQIAAHVARVWPVPEVKN